MRHIYILEGRALDPPLLLLTSMEWSETLVRGVAAWVYPRERSRACRRRRASRNAWGLSLRFCSLRE